MSMRSSSLKLFQLFCELMTPTQPHALLTVDQHKITRLLHMQATNADFATKLYSTPEVAKSARFSKPRLLQTGFTVEHYAGAVTYKTDNFLAKNKDFVVAEHQQLMQNSKHTFVRELFPPEREEQNDKVRCLRMSYRDH